MEDRFGNFIELYFEAIEENIEEVIAQLEEEGIDTEQSQQDILDLIKQKKGELKLERGEQFKKFYQGATGKTDQNNSNGEGENLRLAARKQSADFSENEKKDILSDEEKLKIIKKFKDDAGGQD